MARKDYATDAEPWPINRPPIPRFTCRAAYDPDHDVREGNLAATDTTGQESMTQQHFAVDADINEIARRFGLLDRQLPTMPMTAGEPTDLTNLPDLRQVLEYQRDAVDKFRDLPAKLRKRFDNKPGKMWAFLQDPDNHEEAVRLGLLHRQPPAGAAPAPSSGSTSPASKGTTTEPPPTPPEGAKKETP